MEKLKIINPVEEGLKQEILEECNLDIEKLKEIINKKYLYVRNGKNVIVDTHLFDVIKYSGIMKNNEPDKHKIQEFISIKKIKKLPYLSDVTLLYLESIGFKRKAKI